MLGTANNISFSSILGPIFLKRDTLWDRMAEFRCICILYALYEVYSIYFLAIFNNWHKHTYLIGVSCFLFTTVHSILFLILNLPCLATLRWFQPYSRNSSWVRHAALWMAGWGVCIDGFTKDTLYAFKKKITRSTNF